MIRNRNALTVCLGLLTLVGALCVPGETRAANKQGTNLLFTFLTNQAGFDTAITIANTSADPYGTVPQSGSCVLNFYGANAPAPITTGSVDAGTVYTNLVSSLAPNFQGYVIAQCAFSLAHGWAFVSDIGARNLAASYLATVILPHGRKNNERLDN